MSHRGWALVLACHIVVAASGLLDGTAAAPYSLLHKWAAHLTHLHTHDTHCRIRKYPCD